jgi:hypothetical protein
MSRGWVGAEVEDDPNWLLIAPEGVRREADVSVTPAQYQQMWTGYACAWCGEPWPERWPSKCTLPGCWSGEVMTEEKQRRYLDERYGGEKWFGPSKATLERMANADDRAGHKPKTGIWLPGK